MRIVFRLALFALLSAIGMAQTSTDPVVKLDPLVIEGRLLTESPATVTTVNLEQTPLNLTTNRNLRPAARIFS